VVPAFTWGFVFGNLLGGLPIGADKEFTGSLSSLFTLAGLLGGLLTLSLALLHGAVFLGLKTRDEVRRRARQLAARILPAVLVLTALITTFAADSEGGWLAAGGAVVALAGALAANAKGREGWAFLGTGAAILLVAIVLFTALFPDVVPASTSAAHSLTTTNAAATPYTLEIMSWAALAFTPLVLLYQSWTYCVFLKRIGVSDIPVAVPALP
jgi:cytochrome d ubiquinol oxidase subunit II